jgi:hypothetical protein
MEVVAVTLSLLDMEASAGDGPCFPQPVANNDAASAAANQNPRTTQIRFIAAEDTRVILLVKKET